MTNALVVNVKSVEESWNVTAGIRQVRVVCKIFEECAMPRACQVGFILRFETQRGSCKVHPRNLTSQNDT